MRLSKAELNALITAAGATDAGPAVEFFESFGEDEKTAIRHATDLARAMNKLRKRYQQLQRRTGDEQVG